MAADGFACQEKPPADRYARVSTEDQNLDLQRDALARAGCERVFEDRQSGAKADRPGLTGALEYARSGDTRRVRSTIAGRVGPAMPGQTAVLTLLRRTIVQPGALRRPLFGIYALLLVANLAVWIWAVLVFRDRPVLLGIALLAYGFGLRHAVDADHIAAIDNVTRKLMQAGQRPVAVGFFFAMGHSTVVILAAAAVAGTATALAGSFDQFKAVGGVIGTSVSALFLFAIAVANLIVLRAVWRTFQRVRKGGRYVEEDFDILLNSRGLLARLFRLITRSWHMYPLGFLFGLGFDTATEVALLGTSATQAAKGVSIWSIMVFPALFAAGMSLIDTTDGILMLSAYDWAFIKPIRKLYYNLTITSVSVVIAVLIGGIEALGLLGDQLELKGRFWRAIGALNDNFNVLGFAIIALFIATWVGSVIVYRYQGLDDIEVTARNDSL